MDAYAKGVGDGRGCGRDCGAVVVFLARVATLTSESSTTNLA